jgi:hypothetical protein
MSSSQYLPRKIPAKNSLAISCKAVNSSSQYCYKRNKGCKEWQISKYRRKKRTSG